MWWKSKKPEVIEAKAEKVLEERREKHKMVISEVMMDRLNAMSSPLSDTPRVPPYPNFPVEPYTPPKGVCPAEHVLAMDAANPQIIAQNAIFFSGLGFPGFPYLTELTQLTEYRDMSERIAAEMTRKWIKLRSQGEEDKSETIKVIDAALKRHKIRDLFRYAAVLDGFMGRAQLFMNFGDIEGEELETPLMLNQYKITRDSLRGFKIVEPITTYPAVYNSSNPLRGDYYVPSAWFVYGQKVHATRMLQFISRPLPDLLKPVYNFSGMSLSQLAQPYVDYWLQTRDSVGTLLKNFSTPVLETDTSSALEGGNGQELLKRAAMYTKFRDNQGLFITNKETENFKIENVPLAGLDKLQAQAQEHMAAVAKTPLVVLLGITPTGLNASAEGDMRVWYSYVADQQEVLFRSNLEIVIKVIMLSELGYIDDDITFNFLPLVEMTEKEHALIRHVDASASTQYVAMGAIRPEEVRNQLATDPTSGYDNLNVNSGPIIPPSNLEGGKKDTTGASVHQGVGMGTEMGNELGFGDAFNEVLDSIDGAIDVAEETAKSGLLRDEFHGNQSTGGFGAASEHPYVTSTKLSAIAQAASRRAAQYGTKRNHDLALKAHRRALASHQRSMDTASSNARTVHDAFIDAHTTAIAMHEVALSGGA